MSNPAENRFPPDKLCKLEKLSTEELHYLISCELDAPDVAPDAELIDAIWEVIEKREAGVPLEHNAEASLRAFHERLPEEEAYSRSEMPKASSADHMGQIKPSKRKQRIKLFLRAAAVVAAVFLIFCGVSSVYGVNVYTLIAQWGSETFQYTKNTSTQTPSEVIEDPYLLLRLTVAEETDIPVVPNWAPEGTTAARAVKTTKSSEGLHISGCYQVPQGEFVITVRIYTKSSWSSNGIYFRTDEVGEIVTINNIEHFLSSNGDTFFITWAYENVEVAISGDLSTEDLIHMVTSIYGDDT